MGEWFALAESVIRDVSELPDRTSPDDWPEAMLVTADELRQILVARMAGVHERNERIDSLFDAIKHGDTKHQAWLREAIDAHFSGRAVPPPRSS